MFSPKDVSRFYSKFERLGDDECWEWQRYKLPHGYGLFSYGGKNCLAHRIAFSMHNGELGEGLDVMHSCDNPRCVNPKHLSVGTRTNNMQDAKRKGRTARGSAHGRSKLTEDEAIYALVTPLDQKSTARFLGVSPTAISNIRTGVRWGHLQSVGG